VSAINLGLAQALAALDDREFLARWRDLDDAHRLDALRHRFRYDQAGFLRWCFPRLFSRAYNPYHRATLDRPKLAWGERRGRNILRVDAAPRGIAKTTTAKGEVIHDVCYGLEDHIVIVSAETRLARSITRHLRRIFSAGAGRLHDLFGPFVVEGGVDEFRVTTRHGHTCGILARSFGTQVRGANEDGARPTRIIVDDGERPDRVRNGRLREEDEQFLNDDILGSGPIDGGLIVDWRGTVLHPDALLPRLLRNPGWSGRKWQAVIAWPTRTDLWEQARAIYTDLTIGDPEARWQAAAAFYAEHRADMDAGAELLDADALPLFSLYVEIWTKGLRSVLRERQNDPFDPSTTIFDLTKIRRCRVEGTRIYTSRGTVVEFQDCTFGIWLDPSSGKDDADHPALAVVARDPWGYRYAIHVEGARRSPSAQQAALWGLWERFSAYRPRVGADATGTQGLLGEAFDREREARKMSRRPWNLWPLLHTFGEDKNARISSLEPDLVNGWLELAVDLPEEVNTELRDHPNAVHDDHLDALQAADDLVCERIAGAVHSSRSIRG